MTSGRPRRSGEPRSRRARSRRTPTWARRTPEPELPAGLSDAGAPRSLYLHVPFCRHRCHYCDFSVHRVREAPLDDWLAAIRGELDWWFETLAWRSPIAVDTIFVGGGTPSTLGPESMGRLASLLRRRFTWTSDVEWTAEANPHSTTEVLCAAWREAGLNRLSLGVQSFDDRVLRWLGRLHDARGARDAVAAARAARIDNLNVDLIFGLPDDVPRRWRHEVEQTVRLEVPHVSAYGLSVEPGTPLARGVELGRVEPPGEDRYAEEYRQVAEELAAKGYCHYEVSNFARPGHESRHNWQYWNGSAYLGLGPSAHSYFPPFRLWNVFRWDAYRETVRSGRPPVAGFERIQGDRLRLERFWLGLRTRAGLAIDDPVFTSGGAAAGRLCRWIEAGWLVRDGERVRPTVEGWLRLDELASTVTAAREVENEA